MPKIPAINFLKIKKKNFLDQFIGWALTVGRIIIILTEIVALSSFLYRFSLDRQLIDLHDKIKQKQAIVELLKDNEEKYRKIQAKLSYSKDLTIQSKKFDQILKDIYDFLPSDSSIDEITVGSDNVRISLSMQSVESLDIFIKSLKNYKETSSISLDNIDNKISTGSLDVSIGLILKTNKNEKI